PQRDVPRGARGLHDVVAARGPREHHPRLHQRRTRLQEVGDDRTMKRHTISEFGTGRQSMPLASPVVLKRQARLMEKAGRAKSFHIRFGREDLYGIARDYKGCLKRSQDLLGENHPAGELYTVGVADSPNEGDAVHPIAKVFNVEVGPKPVATDGTPAIDLIYGAVWAEFNDRYGIV